MKYFTKHILPRLTWFHLYYGQWFKHTDGIKGFAEQSMNWLMKEVLNLATSLQNENKRLGEEIRVLKSNLSELYLYPTVNADEFPSIKSKLRSYTFLIWCAVAGEFFFNFFAAKSLLDFPGWVAVLGQVLLAAFLTYGFFKIFENLFVQLFNEPKYKTEVKPQRHLGKLLFLLGVALAYEIGVFYLCQVRGITIDGHGNGLIGHALMIFGMLFPIVAGYYGYEKHIYKSAFKNTLDIKNAAQQISKRENKIKTNDKKMEIHFKQTCQKEWTIFQEFKTYKEVYNMRRKISPENLSGHFCATHESYIQEATDRYLKEPINQEELEIVYAVKSQQQNGTFSKSISNPI